MWSLSPRIKTYTRFSLSARYIISQFPHIRRERERRKRKKPSQYQRPRRIRARRLFDFSSLRWEKVELKDGSIIHNKTVLSGSRTKSVVHFVESIRVPRPTLLTFPFILLKGSLSPSYWNHTTQRVLKPTWGLFLSHSAPAVVESGGEMN